MQKQEKVLVVIDPAEEHHPALERAITNAQIRETAERSHLVLLITPALPKEKSAHQTVRRKADWIAALEQSVTSQNIPCDVMVSWSADWATNILSAAQNQQVDMVMLPLYAEPGDNRLISDEKWSLLRKSDSPVLLVRPGGKERRKIILASVKVQDDRYAELNQRVVERGAWGAWRYGADLHIVNAYSDSSSFPDRNKIARMTEIDNDRIHIQHGEPDKVISEIANKIDADMILVGTHRRSGIQAALRGNTIEKIVGNVTQDVMLMV